MPSMIHIYHITASWLHDNTRYAKEMVICANDGKSASDIALNRLPVAVTKGEATELKFRTRDMGVPGKNKTYYSSDVTNGLKSVASDLLSVERIAISIGIAYGSVLTRLKAAKNNATASMYASMLGSSDDGLCEKRIFEWASEYASEKHTERPEDFLNTKLNEFLKCNISALLETLESTTGQSVQNVTSSASVATNASDIEVIMQQAIEMANAIKAVYDSAGLEGMENNDATIETFVATPSGTVAEVEIEKEDVSKETEEPKDEMPEELPDETPAPEENKPSAEVPKEEPDSEPSDEDEETEDEDLDGDEETEPIPVTIVENTVNDPDLIEDDIPAAKGTEESSETPVSENPSTEIPHDEENKGGKDTSSSLEEPANENYNFPADDFFDEDEPELPIIEDTPVYDDEFPDDIPDGIPDDVPDEFVTGTSDDTEEPAVVSEKEEQIPAESVTEKPVVKPDAHRNLLDERLAQSCRIEDMPTNFLLEYLSTCVTANTENQLKSVKTRKDAMKMYKRMLQKNHALDRFEDKENIIKFLALCWYYDGKNYINAQEAVNDVYRRKMQHPEMDMKSCLLKRK